MKKGLFLLVALLQMNTASAEIIDFEDINTGSTPQYLTKAYKGFNWNVSSPTGVVKVGSILPTNSFTGLKNNVIFNISANLPSSTTIIKKTDATSFNFISGFFAKGIDSDGTAGNITLTAYKNNSLVHTSSAYTLSKTADTKITLNWTGIDEIRITSNNTFWVADNLNMSAVPEPSQAILFSLGLIAMVRRTIKQRT